MSEQPGDPTGLDQMWPALTREERIEAIEWMAALDAAGKLLEMPRGTTRLETLEVLGFDLSTQAPWEITPAAIVRAMARKRPI